MIRLSDLRWTEGMFLFETSCCNLSGQALLQGHSGAVQWLTMHHPRMDTHGGKEFSAHMLLYAHTQTHTSEMWQQLWQTAHWTELDSLSNVNEAWRFWLEKDKHGLKDKAFPIDPSRTRFSSFIKASKLLYLLYHYCKCYTASDPYR